MRELLLDNQELNALQLANMPIFEYQCDICEYNTEEIHSKRRKLICEVCERELRPVVSLGAYNEGVMNKWGGTQPPPNRVSVRY